MIELRWATVNPDGRAARPAPIIRDAAISIAFCASVVLMLLLVDPIDSMTTPETAFDDGEIVLADWIYVGRFFAGAFLLTFAALFHWRSRGSRILIGVPVFALLVLGFLTVEREAGLAHASVLRARFAASRVELDSLVARIAAGEQPPIGIRVGAFDIFAHEQVGDTVFIYTKTDDRREHRWGFAYAPAVRENLLRATASELGMAEPFGSRHSARPLGDGWFVIYNSYVFVKRGWS